MPRRRFDGITMAQLSGCAIVFAAWLFIDQIPGHGADKLRLLGVMREHSVDVAAIPGSNPGFGKSHHRLIGHMHHMSLLTIHWLYSPRPYRKAANAICSSSYPPNRA